MSYLEAKTGVPVILRPFSNQIYFAALFILECQIYFAALFVHIGVPNLFCGPLLQTNPKQAA
ncbi:MAG: hypothetical protein DRR16_19705 [Candidatus Parabeggiatoa sp. nov. 3]|nr:MAG: hypothetical protein DRR00_24095 [Gammaproteobacteria bacterium]RKZ61137.1 MAG: hypothetical protein DRQ99_20945 [Gammaproteobacteria bacterium]RKZ82418.1 MAG: hypothetical protein DRR16_19705 [Gammaproteobacteria bacterium]